ncbi:MAG: AAA family ATPase [Planctomycetaceae bacterium]
MGSELNELRQALRHVKEGSLSLVWMRGRSGFGKSRLISQFLQHEDVRSERRSLVLSGRCYERESIPFKAFDPLIDQLTRELSRLTPETLAAVLPVDVAALSRVFPVLREVAQIAAASQKGRAIPDVQELRQRAFIALRELLARLASRRCLILCLDDLQWCDPDSVPRADESPELWRMPAQSHRWATGCRASRNRRPQSWLDHERHARPTHDAIRRAH